MKQISLKNSYVRLTFTFLEDSMLQPQQSKAKSLI